MRWNGFRFTNHQAQGQGATPRRLVGVRQSSRCRREQLVRSGLTARQRWKLFPLGPQQRSNFWAHAELPSRPSKLPSRRRRGQFGSRVRPCGVTPHRPRHPQSPSQRFRHGQEGLARGRRVDVDSGRRPGMIAIRKVARMAKPSYKTAIAHQGPLN